MPGLIGEEVNDRDFKAVFHLAFAEVVQEGSPISIFFQIIRDAFRQKNMTRVAAIHHPLRQVDARASDIGAPVQIGHFTHRAAMNAHSHLDLWVFL